MKRYQNINQAMMELLPLVDETRYTQDKPSLDSQRMLNIFLNYQEEHQLNLTRLIEDFTSKAKKLGVHLKVVDLRDS